MYQIATLNKISKVGLAELTDDYTITEDISQANGILVRSADMHDMEFSDDLLAIARAGAGVNNIPLERCAEAGIVVFNTPGANANAVKELTIAGLFLAARNIPSALTWAAGLTEDVSKTVEKGKSQFAGTEITGKTLGVAGLGAIGRKVAAAAGALGMKIVGYDPYFDGEADFAVYDDLKKMLAVCDYVTIHIPANDATKGMFNAELFAAMKDGAVVLNFSRDKLVKDDDLLLTAYGQGTLTAPDFQQGAAGNGFETDENSEAVFTASSGGTYTFYALDAAGNETVQTVTIQVRSPGPVQFLPPMPGGGWGFARPGQHRFGW